jgi:hypothetical protein
MKGFSANGRHRDFEGHNMEAEADANENDIVKTKAK